MSSIVGVILATKDAGVYCFSEIMVRCWVLILSQQQHYLALFSTIWLGIFLVLSHKFVWKKVRWAKWSVNIAGYQKFQSVIKTVQTVLKTYRCIVFWQSEYHLAKGGCEYFGMHSHGNINVISKLAMWIIWWQLPSSKVR